MIDIIDCIVIVNFAEKIQDFCFDSKRDLCISHVYLMTVCFFKISKHLHEQRKIVVQTPFL